ncbi:MAG TPA: Rpn family recombination-promoting nuclease/putative transposase, partial [Enhygromyxa sp.]|nr:Rpn family recombination-promoting nuclease/putative transposase [Enhygromyxa sp.]
MTNRAHDALFKAGFANPSHIRGLYSGTYPAEICERIDWSSTSPEPASFVDANLDDNHSDLLFSTRWHPPGADWTTEQLYLYLLLEHHSTNIRYLPLRVYTYLERIYDLQRSRGIESLAHVLPLIISHAPGGWTGPRRFGELFEPPAHAVAGLTKLTPQFEVTILDLSKMSNEEIKGRALTVFAQLVLWLLRDGRSSEQLLSNLAHWEAAFVQALRSPFGVAAVARLLRYVYEV